MTRLAAQTSLSQRSTDDAHAPHRRRASLILLASLLLVSCDASQAPAPAPRSPSPPPTSSQPSEPSTRDATSQTTDVSRDLSSEAGNNNGAPDEAFDAPRSLLHPDEALRRSAAIGGVLGTLSDVEGEAMALIDGVTLLLNAHLPDVDATLRALDDYRENVRSRVESLASILRPRKLYLKRRRLLDNYEKRMRGRFRDELQSYQRAVARFERFATPEQILRFNAAIKSLTAPIAIR